MLDHCCLALLKRLSDTQPCLRALHSITAHQQAVLDHLHARRWPTEAVAEDVDVVMELLAVAQAEEAPSQPAAEEETVAVEEETVAAVVTAVAATVAEIAVVDTVEVAIGAEVAVTEVAAAADGHLRKSTRLPPEESPSRIPRSRPSRRLAKRPANLLSSP